MDNNMNEAEIALKIKKAKRANYTIFSIFIALFVLLTSCSIIRNHQRTFTTEKWLNNPTERTKIVDNLLLEYDLMGKTEEEILSLLGPDSDSGYFAQEDRYVYRLGDERGYISIDSEWLIIDFENGSVTDYYITTD